MADEVFPEPSETWAGSKPEWAVYWALLKLGMKGKFSYQLGGRMSKGGAVLDFYFPDLNLAINVQSTYYHYKTATQQARGELQRAQLESMGITVVYVHEEDVLRDPIFYVKEALAGREHTR